MSVRGYFLKKRKPCMQNLMKERNQPPEALLQQLIFDIRFIGACDYESLEVSIKVFSS